MPQENGSQQETAVYFVDDYTRSEEYVDEDLIQVDHVIHRLTSLQLKLIR
jgi:hypothetical protein